MQNTVISLRSIVCGFIIPPSWSGIRGFAVMLMLAAQIALGVHQFQHHASLEADSENHCALCQVASGQNTGARPPVVAHPSQTTFYTLRYFPPERVPHRLPVVADYQSRAPPIPVSI